MAKLGDCVCSLSRLSMDMTDSSMELVLRVPKEQAYRARQIYDAVKEMEAGGKDRLSVTISEYRKQRSLDANALCWKLCTEISMKLCQSDPKNPVTKEEVYQRNIREGNEFWPFPIPADRVEEFKETWGSKGIGWFVDVVDDSKLDGYKKVFAYYGSSTYNTEQMSHLLDRIIEDAKSVGVEVLSERELSLIKEDWNAENQAR